MVAAYGRVRPAFFVNSHSDPSVKSLCLFCGSSPGARPIYLETARAAGRLLAERGIRMIYGGGSVGLMGAAADGCLEAGGEVVGVITHQLQKLEVGHGTLSMMEVVNSMHERKARMAELADGFIALPGGIGTLEELFEAFTWAQLEIHTKPCGILNVDGYYDHMIAFLEHVVDERFLLKEHGQLLLDDKDFGSLVERMLAFEPVRLEKWVERTTSGQG